MRTTATAIVLLLSLSTGLDAQAPLAGPRAGAWGAEISFDNTIPGIGGAILRFRDDRSAWLFGLTGNVEHQEPENDSDDPFPQEARTIVAASARIGMRSYRAPGSSIRPVVGFGLTGTLGQTTGIQRTWDAGGYAELGIARFFGESFSLGATADVYVRAGEQRDRFALKTTTFRGGIDVLRVLATVVF